MTDHNFEQKLIAAYDKMMQRINTVLDDAEQQAIPALERNIDWAKQQAIELKEITAEEAEKIADYIRRDLHDAAHYLETTGKELSSWVSFDIQQVEGRMFELFSKVADKTRLELAKLAMQAKRAQEYHTGEIIGIGTLSCQACDTKVHFKRTSRIPPCPKCHKTVFVRSRKK